MLNGPARGLRIVTDSYAFKRKPMGRSVSSALESICVDGMSKIRLSDSPTTKGGRAGGKPPSSALLVRRRKAKNLEIHAPSKDVAAGAGSGSKAPSTPTTGMAHMQGSRGSVAVAPRSNGCLMMSPNVAVSPLISSSHMWGQPSPSPRCSSQPATPRASNTWGRGLWSAKGAEQASPRELLWGGI
jgi:hypothetical protein